MSDSSRKSRMRAALETSVTMAEVVMSRKSKATFSCLLACAGWCVRDGV